MMKPKISALPNRLNTVPRPALLMVLGIIAVIVTFFFWLNLPAEIHTEFTDHFHSLSDTALRRRGWLIADKDSVYWSKRDAGAKGLRLFTLRRSAGNGQLPNLLLRPLPYDCFSTEVQLDAFLPGQQGVHTGIVLLQDRTFHGKRLELSLGSGLATANGEQPHVRYSWDDERPGDTASHTSPDPQPRFSTAGQHIVLRIEKSGQRFTLRYAVLSGRDRSFQTIAVRKLALRPRFIGLFAVDNTGRSSPAPVIFSYFRLSGKPCDY